MKFTLIHSFVKQLAHDTIKEEAFFAYFTIISLTSKPTIASDIDYKGDVRISNWRVQILVLRMVESDCQLQYKFEMIKNGTNL